LSYTANTVDQYTAVGQASLTYDPDHNLNTYDGAVFWHDWDNQLILAYKGNDSLSFGRDGLGRCVKQNLNGVDTYITYDGWNPIYESDASGNRTASRIYGPGTDELISGLDAAYITFYYHQDHLGNVTALSGSDGKFAELYSYDPFGKAYLFDLATGNALSQSKYGNNFAFQGHPYLPQLGIYDFRNRAYSSDLGRFLEVDPIRQAGGSNLFAFAGNNPVSGTDPFGLENNLGELPPITVEGYQNPTDVVTYSTLEGSDNESKVCSTFE
jgi:RHS repeat-associated protein